MSDSTRNPGRSPTTNTNTDATEYTRQRQGRTNAIFYNGLELADPLNKQKNTPKRIASNDFRLALLNGRLTQINLTLQQQLATTNPQFQIQRLPSLYPQPAFRDLLPTDVANLALWLDGQDTRSMTFSGNSVTQWNDKSGNGRNAIANSSATYDGSDFGLIFNGTNYYTTSYTAQPSEETGFMIYKDTLATVQTSVILCGPTTTTTGGRMYVSYDESGGYVFKIDKFAVASYGPLNINLNTRVMAGAAFSPTASSAYTHLNGTVSSPFTVSFTTDGTTQIGAGANGGSPWAGLIYECIFYNRYLTTFQRQQIEGYLAWKWGLQGSLPANHPYKSAKPIVPL